MASGDHGQPANSMEPERVRAAVLETLAAIAPGTDVRALAADRPLRDQVDLDSIDWINVIVGLSERLSIDIPESDYGRLATLDSIVACVVALSEDRGTARPAVGQAAALAELPSTQHLVNGTWVTVRPMRADDAGLETGFIEHLSNASRYERFMLTVRELPKSKLKYLTDVDQVRHVALVATADRGGQETMIGAARYVVDPAGIGCEFAVAVDDAWKRSGVAGLLMLALMKVARSRRLKTMEGSVLATNSGMLKFARDLGFRQERDPGYAQTVRIVREL
jgi:acetyltransferase